VAIKKISNCFDSPVDAKRMLREVKLLSHLRHENVIGLRDVLPPPNPTDYKDV
jgi:mitogen-activated protein kinase 1/3